eukprot:scaffold186690_cov41-Attheya_sp.AAC.1
MHLSCRCVVKIAVTGAGAADGGDGGGCLRYTYHDPVRLIITLRYENGECGTTKRRGGERIAAAPGHFLKIPFYSGSWSNANSGSIGGL